MNRHELMATSAIIVAAALSAATSATAQDAKTFSIPSGALGQALNAFGAQAGVQIMFSGQLVAGRSFGGLEGRYTVAAALTRLLDGTGLTWSEVRPGVIFIRAEAQTVSEGPATDIGEIVVTGTLFRTPGAQASPVVALDRSSLDRSGYGTVAEAVTALPQNYSGSGTPQALFAYADPGGSNSSAATGVNLRGLGPDATLLLVNGRRMAGTGSRGEFSDLSALPSAAVERVDVLLDGSSALYGSDAVAGVVNVVMRRTHVGQESRLRVAAAQGGAEDITLSHLAGRTWSTGAALLAWEYQTANALNASDRRYTADGDLRPFGGTDRRSVYSSPGNILQYDASKGGYVAAYGIRPPAGGSAQAPEDLAAGSANLQAQLLGVDLVPDTERHSLYGKVRQSIGERLELTADVRFSDRRFGFDNPATLTIFQVSAANPHFVSAAGETSHLIGYSFMGDTGVSRQEGRSRSLGLTAGARYDLGRSWTLDGYVAVAEERGTKTTTGLVNSAFLNEALGNTPDNPGTSYSAARDGYFNPYGAGQANSAAVLDLVGSGQSSAVDRGRAESVNLLLDGKAFDLPGGPLAVAVGVQVRRESYGARLGSTTSSVAPREDVTPTRDRTIAGLFGELRIPIVGEENSRTGVRNLELSVAGRIEDYEDFGTTTNPKIGLVWSPTDALTIRGSWGTSFRAPALPQLHDLSQAAPTFVRRADGASVLSLYRYGGNPDLAPETAETWTAGLDYRPASDLRLSLSYFDTRFTDRIAQPVSENLAGALLDPALRDFVQLIDPANNPQDLALIRSFIEDPGYGSGGLYPATSYGAILDARWGNASEVEVRGLDVQASRRMTFGEHGLEVQASASRLLAYETRLTPTATSVSRLDQVGYPVRLRNRVGATWFWRDLSAGGAWSHVSSYRDLTDRRIEAWNTADIQFSWRPSVGPLADLQLIATLQNLFDEDPPFYDSPTGLGFDPGQANLLGRVASLQLIKRW